MKKTLSLLLAVLLCTLAFTGCGDDQTNGGDSGELPYYEWSLSCEYSSENHQTIALQDAAKKIEEETDGHIKITVYPNMALGDYTVVYGQIMSGDIEIAACPISPQYDQRADAVNMPFLATSFDEFKRDYFEGGFVWNLISDINSNNGVKLMGVLNAGFMGLGSKTVDKEDFAYLTGTETKKTLMRAPAAQVYNDVMAAMGYNTTSIPYADLYSSMQSGLCDGWIGGSGLTNYDSFRDAIKYFVDCNVINECIPVHMNQALFDELPAEYQTIVANAFNEAQTRVNDERAEQEAQALVDMEAYGIKVISPTGAELTELRDRLRKEVWPKMIDTVGQDVIDSACEAYGVTL